MRLLGCTQIMKRQAKFGNLILFASVNSCSTNLSKMLLNKLSCFVVQFLTAMLFCKVSNTDRIRGVKLTFQEYTARINDISDL
jgi:hypothetical protein